MTWPVNFSGLAGGNEPLSLFDAMFAQVAAMVPIPCTATGTNAITLNPIGNAPSAANLGAYGSLNLFSFLASATSTGVVSAQFGALASLPVFKNDGTTAVTTGDIAIAHPYMLMFSQALNSGGGGFYLLRPAVQPAGGQPTYQRFLSGSGTYTTPANCLQIVVRMVGGGGGGGGRTNSGTGGTGGTGGTTTFALNTAIGGSGGAGSGVATGNGGNGGTGGTTLTGIEIIRIGGAPGASGLGAPTSAAVLGGAGGTTPLGSGAQNQSIGLSGPLPANTGAGGPGNPTSTLNTATAGGGGGGEYVEFVISSPAATYPFTVGLGGTVGIGADANGVVGSAGAIYVQERYQD
jgi:hypothetical protein